MNTRDHDLLWIGATSYYLGRQTIATHSFCDLLMSSHGKLSESIRVIILRDIKEAFDSDDKDRERNKEFFMLGSDIDREKWLNVLSVFSGL
jgi:hypothetical protein